MKKNKKYIVTYCSNIFKTKNINKLIFNVKKYLLSIKNIKKYISLCLSKNLLKKINIIKKIFKLQKDEKIFVKSINGFVYQDFHKKYIKEKIYLPDWTSKYRLLYTKDIITLIKKITKKNSIINISTMPISYKDWSIKKYKKIIIYKSIKNIAILINKKAIKKSINISLEPEPCCLLECNSNIIKFYELWVKKLIINFKKYICICYDICHLSVMFEKHEINFKLLKKKEIKIGKIQISSALKTIIPKKNIYIKLLFKILLKIKNSNFLHQCIIKNKHKIEKHNDIIKIIKSLINKKNLEVRIHCHIPIYKKTF
jgi:hypothetical protein